MQTKGTFYKLAIGLAAAVAAVYGWRLLAGRKPRPSAAALAQLAVAAKTEAQRQKAAVDLAGAGPDALPHLRRLLRESSDPFVRATCAQGLSDLDDYQSIDLLIAALQDDSPGNKGKLVRMRAAAALSHLLRRELDFPAAAAPDERARAVARIRNIWQEMRNPAAIEKLKQSDSYQGPWAEAAGSGTASSQPTVTQAGKDREP